MVAEKMSTTHCPRCFTLTNDSNGHSYDILANENATLDIVWASQKCWFLPGAKVTISDDLGHVRTFKKEFV